MENQANLERLDRLASPENPHWKFAKKCRHRRANHARLDHLDPLAHPESLVFPDQTDRLARLAKTDNPAPTDLLDPTDHLALLARTARKAHLATQRPQFQPRPATKAQTAKVAHLARLVNLAALALTVNQADLVRKAHLATLDPTETTVLLATKDPLAQTATKVNRVSVRNTARWTAAFSSKTARGDKRLPTDCTRNFFNDQHVRDIIHQTEFCNHVSFAIFFSCFFFFLVSSIYAVHCDPD